MEILLFLLCIVGLVDILNQTVKAAPLPPSSLPLDNVFAVPRGAQSQDQEELKG